MSVADELKKMKELLDEGIISEDEFEKEKTKLLNPEGLVNENQTTQNFTFSEQISNLRPRNRYWRPVVTVINAPTLLEFFRNKSQ